MTGKNNSHNMTVFLEHFLMHITAHLCEKINKQRDMY